jgi:alpha,alpha-trehalase
VTEGFAPVRRERGHLPIEDYGLIGDGCTAALVGRDGAIDWMCLPRFDSPPVFAALLDPATGGRFAISIDGLQEARQHYLDDTAVLVTELRGPEGLLRITDALILHADADLSEDAQVARGELVRRLEVPEGRVRVRIEIGPRGRTHGVSRGGGVRVFCHERRDLDLQISGSCELDDLRADLELEQGDSRSLMLRWRGGHYYYHPLTPEEQLKQTASAWRRWSRGIAYEGPERDMVRRSAITLKLLDHIENGAIIAAPTTSLPEWIGAELNWDYRYVWIRDAAFSVYAMHRIGLSREAGAFLGWVLDQVERHDHPRILYDVLGQQPEPEWEDPTLEGWHGSKPVRFGNGAADQRQDDVYGEIIDCAWQWVDHDGMLDDVLWRRLCGLAKRALRRGGKCDHGIWELRNEGRPYTYTAGLCHVALDRIAKLARLRGDEEGAARWAEAAGEVQRGILDKAWDEDLQSLTMYFGGGGLDASLLALPLRRVVAADHPRMKATIERVAERLGAGDGLVHRFHDRHSPEPLPTEGAFLLCSFWLCENLVLLGRLDEAGRLFESLCRRANPLGLLPEMIDPGSGRFLGNFPQAFSHVGVIAAGVRLARSLQPTPSR